MTTDVPSFVLRVEQNAHLAVGARTVHAILEVSAVDPRAAAGGPPPDAAEVIIIDRSGSMSGRKMKQALLAAAAAVDVLRDGVFFAIVAGQSSAQVVYPAEPVMVRASERTRAEAKRALRGVTTAGGTSMSTWLTLAELLLSTCPAPLKHAIMLTDGQNTEGTALLTGALSTCAGRFVCDCRGVGDDWSLTQLKEIAGALLGSWKPIASPDQLSDDFRSLMAASMRKRVSGVTLRVRPNRAATLTHLARVLPSIEELTDKGVPVQEGRAFEFPLGSWGVEERAYDLRLDLAQQDLNIENDTQGRAARVEVLVPSADGGSAVVAGESVLVAWSTDAALSGLINEAVAGYSGQEELAQVVNRAVQAWDEQASDVGVLLGRAVALAHRLGRDDLLEQLSRMAFIEDPAAGLVRPRPRGEVERGVLHQSSWLSEQSSAIGERQNGRQR